MVIDVYKIPIREVWVIICFIIGLLNCSYGENSVRKDQGCILSPEIGKEDIIQKNILNDLKTHGFYGKRFTCTPQSKDKYKYEFAFCDDVKEDEPNGSLLMKDELQGTCEVIGQRNVTVLSGEFGNWVSMVMSSNKSSLCTNHTVTSSIMILCDRNYPKGELNLLYKDSVDCKFVFELRTAEICGSPPGMSGWEIFFILLIVGLVLYCIFGVLYLRLQTGAKGIDQIPNRNFWFGLGNKLADGCSAVCRCDQYCGDPIDQLDSHSQYSGGYSPIGEGTPAVIATQNSERDSPLIKP